MSSPTLIFIMHGRDKWKKNRLIHEMKDISASEKPTRFQTITIHKQRLGVGKLADNDKEPKRPLYRK